jgi:parallel beta-helix repeat protein/predicted outer membrane repeat protein
MQMAVDLMIVAAECTTQPAVSNVTFANNVAFSAAAFSTYGGGMSNFNNSHPTLNNVTFSNNAAAPDGYGGGMSNTSYSHPILTNVTFSNNTASVSGGGMYNFNNSSPTLTNVFFSGNDGDWYGGGLYNYVASSPVLSNVIFFSNTARYGGGLYSAGIPNNVSRPTLTNGTFSGNTASISGGGLYNSSNSNPTLTNSILWGDSAPSGTEIFNSGSTPTVTYSDVQGGYAGTGNIDSNPLFADSASGNLRPRVGSPAIDAGTNSGCPVSDMDGNPRPFGSACDMGAYETPFSDIIYVDVDATGWATGASWTDAFTDMQAAIAAAKSGNEIWVATGTYTPGTLRTDTFQLKSGVAVYGGFDGTEATRDERDPAAHVTVLSGDIDSNDNQTPIITDLLTVTGNTTNSYHVVIGATGATLDGFTITAGYANGSNPNQLGAGMYNTGSSPTLANLIFSGNAASSGGGMMNWEASNPTLTNITFSHNAATSNGGGMYNYLSSPQLTAVVFEVNTAASEGGGMFNFSSSSPTLTDTTFYSNTAAEGGGMHNYSSSSPHLTDVTFNDNTASSRGGGMYNYLNSSPTLTRATFSANSATNEGGGMYNFTDSSPIIMDVIFSGNSASYGGGMFNQQYGNPTLTNCTFSDNTAGFGGGIYNKYQSSPTLKNCVFSSNTANQGGGLHNYDQSSPHLWNVTLYSNSAGQYGGGIYNDLNSNPLLINSILWGNTSQIYNITGSSPLVTYSDIQGGYAGTGNINLNPLFADPANDNLRPRAGSPVINAGTNSGCPTSDMDGNPRPFGATCDMGAYETAFSGIIYVDVDATGWATGASWADAFTNMQDALTVAHPGTEVWVAAGTYKPTTGTDRTATFQLKDGVGVYGGFAGTETTRDQRNWTANVTILSGDIDNNDSQTPIITDITTVTGTTTNSYHVVIGADGATLDGFTITAGNANGASDPDYFGGGMFNATSEPAVTNVIFSGNQSGGDGGGMFNWNSSPALTNVTFVSNRAAFYGGGMGNQNYNSPTLTNVTFTDNHATYGGGMSNRDFSNPVLVNVTFDGNQGSDQGGGMYNFNYSSPTLTDVTFTGNQSPSGGGMNNYANCNPSLTDVTFSDNQATNGGGMYNYSSSPTLTNITFSRNSATNYGGGMYNDAGSPTLTNVTFSGNSAFEGGGMYNSGSSPTLTNVTFSSNSANYGGGMYVLDGNPTLTNVTFSGNSVTNNGGGMYEDSSSPTLTNVTLRGNSAGGRGGGIFNLSHCYPQIRNSIFWDNTAGDMGPQIHSDINNDFPSVSDSVVQGGCPPGMITCTNIIATDPVLGALGNYGGFTQTIPLLANSSAIDMGNDGVGVCPAADQRGITRPQGAHCDIGAFELVDTTAPDTSIDSKTPAATPTNSTSISFTFSGTDTDSGVRSFECDLDGGGFTACGSPRSFTGLIQGVHTFEVIAINFLGMADPSPASYTWTVDLTTPSLTVPTDITIEATSAAGRVVNYPAATATDNIDPNPVVACLPASGSTFPLGLTTVNCTATDDAGNVANGSFTITVVDTTDPILTVPANMTVNATTSAGEEVNFTATATDAIDPAPVVACNPPSGSLFPFGVTTVDCTATDDANNVASGSFTITVQHNPNEVVPYNPTSGEALHYNRPTFDWSDYPAATGYQIQISRNNTFTQLVSNTTLRTAISTYTPTLNLTANMTLYWRVRAKLTLTTYSAWSEIRGFRTANPPGVPTLSAPANNALIVGPYPLFNWNNSTVPAGTAFDHYQIQISTSSAFIATVHDLNIAGIANSQDSSADLPAGATYYWRVRSFNTAGDYSTWSLVRSVRIKYNPPTLILPANTSVTGSLLPTFTWNATIGATNYTLQVSKSSSFIGLAINKTVTVPNFTATTSLTAGTKYYWRVRVNGPYGPSAWSGVFSFTTP